MDTFGSGLKLSGPSHSSRCLFSHNEKSLNTLKPLFNLTSYNTRSNNCFTFQKASMEGFKLSKANLVVYLHPSKGNNVPQAIRYELSKLLFKYHEVFDGVILAYDGNVVGTNVKILPRIHPNEIVEKQTTNAKIRPSIHPYFGVRLKAKLLLFSPKPDMLLEGKVMKLGAESLHVVVLGFCSAAITENEIRPDFRYKIKHGEEVYATRSDKRHVIKVGSMIRFLVKSMDEEILHISGSLLPPNTGSIKWLDHHMDGAESERRVKKRKGENSKQTRMQANGPFDEQLLQQESDRSFMRRCSTFYDGNLKAGFPFQH